MIVVKYFGRYGVLEQACAALTCTGRAGEVLSIEGRGQGPFLQETVYKRALLENIEDRQ